MACTVGQYLLLRLRQLGVEHVFGVPGDFAMNLFEQVRRATSPWGDTAAGIGR